jgi:hypothetical protein
MVLEMIELRSKRAEEDNRERWGDGTGSLSMSVYILKGGGWSHRQLGPPLNFCTAVAPSPTRLAW